MEAQSIYPNKLPKAKFLPVWTFAGRSVQFVPVANVPGFTHRVLVDNEPRDWLGYGKPSAKTAEYFMRKHWDRPNES